MDNVIQNAIRDIEISLYDKNYSKEEIMNNLKSEEISDITKVFYVINLDEITSQDEFNILISNLTNRTSPLREAVSSKLEEINENYQQFFLNDFALSQILKGITDINPNVCRAICNIVHCNDLIKEKIEEKIIENIFELLNEIEQFKNTNDDFFQNSQRNTKSHAKNKKLFSLYWYLESLSACLSKKYSSKVLEILKKTINFHDYTIREKTAKILAKMDDIPNDLLQKTKDDQNFYVKYQVYDKINKEN